MCRSKSTICIEPATLTKRSASATACCRLLNYATVYGVSFHKYVMWRRGVLNSPFARDPQKISLDADDIRAIEALMAAWWLNHTAALPITLSNSYR